MTEYFGLVINLRNIAPSQYADFNFNSMTKFRGEFIGANEDGIFKLTGTDDNGTGIRAEMELPTLDFESAKLRKLFVGGESGGNIKITTKNDEKNERVFSLSPPDKDGRQFNGKCTIGRNGKGRYWTIKIENERGNAIAIDSISVVINPHSSNPSG